jgi:lysophospholipase L1-like esterase
MLIRLQKNSTGTAFIALLLTILIVFTNCTKKTPATYFAPAITDTVIITGGGGGTPTDSSAKRILALGDSYTIGQSVAERERFANQTINLLQAAGVKMKYPAQIIAQTGWTTQNLLNGIATATPTPIAPYDLVTLLIGVNNQYQKRDTAEYRIQFKQCLNEAIAFSGNRLSRVFVLSIPDYGATPFGSNNAAQIALEIDQFNAINRQVCTQIGVNYTDITPSTREAVNDRTLVAPDGLHPSGKEYAKWATMLQTKMLPLVK